MKIFIRLHWLIVDGCLVKGMLTCWTLWNNVSDIKYAYKLYGIRIEKFRIKKRNS